MRIFEHEMFSGLRIVMNNDESCHNTYEEMLIRALNDKQKTQEQLQGVIA